MRRHWPSPGRAAGGPGDAARGFLFLTCDSKGPCQAQHRLGTRVQGIGRRAQVECLARASCLARLAASRRGLRARRVPGLPRGQDSANGGVPPRRLERRSSAGASDRLTRPTTVRTTRQDAACHAASHRDRQLRELVTLVSSPEGINASPTPRPLLREVVFTAAHHALPRRDSARRGPTPILGACGATRTHLIELGHAFDTRTSALFARRLPGTTTSPRPGVESPRGSRSPG